jgi:hypothetical protein
VAAPLAKEGSLAYKNLPDELKRRREKPPKAPARGSRQRHSGVTGKLLKASKQSAAAEAAAITERALITGRGCAWGACNGGCRSDGLCDVSASPGFALSRQQRRIHPAPNVHAI